MAKFISLQRVIYADTASWFYVSSGFKYPLRNSLDLIESLSNRKSMSNWNIFTWKENKEIMALRSANENES